MKPSCKIIECELCHTENPSTAIFCKHCGNHFDNKPIATIKCKHCNTYNPFFAKYCKKCGKQLQTKNTTFITWIWILAIILIISIIICIFQVIDKHNLESKYKSQLGTTSSKMQEIQKELLSNSTKLDSIQNELSSQTKELNSIKSELDKIDLPIVISKISQENYNNTLIFEIYYYSIINQDITLEYRIFCNNIVRAISTFVIHNNAYHYSNCEISVWCDDCDNSWSSDDYRYEIWYGDKCLGVKRFTVY